MKWVMIICIAVASMACSKTELKDPDFSELTKELTGAWKEIGDCEGCREFQISLEELTVHDILDNKEETMPFAFFIQDSIEVYRNIDGQLMHTRHRVIFHKDGTVEIKNFIRGEETVVYTSPSDVENFHPILLKKTK